MADSTTFDPNQFNVNFTPTPSPVNTEAGIYAGINSGYAGAIAGQEKAPAMISRFNDQFGVPQLQSSIAAGNAQYDALGNQISNMPKEIAQRSQESILTQGQKDRQVTAESAPLLTAQGMVGQKLTRDQTNLGVANTNVSQMVTATQVDQQKALDPWLKQYDTEAIMSTMRMTGWTFDNKNELDRLLANQSAGVTLTNAERSRMNDLAIAEKNYANQLEMNKNTTAANRYSTDATSAAARATNLTNLAKGY